MKHLVAACSLLVASVALAVPEVSNVSLSTNETGKVVVSYSLSETAIVTCEILTNGVVIGRTFTGDANVRVAAGDHRQFLWLQDADGVGSTERLTARVTAWSLDNPPDYLAVSLSVKNQRRYYATAEMVPYGIGSERYKLDWLLMRKIPAKDIVWRMGQPDGGETCSPGSSHPAATLRDEYEIGHLVKLTQDFYIGVYELTQHQYCQMSGKGVSQNNYGLASHSSVTNDFSTYPAEKAISYEDLRGKIDASFAGWPTANHVVKPGSVLANVRAFTGVTTLDLPTEAQWEYACRAGTATSLNSGENVKGAGVDKNFQKVGWQKNDPAVVAIVADGTTMPVGLKPPNAWGLYDMHGNVFEKCLDWHSTGDAYKATFAEGWEDGAVTVDPKGPETGTQIACRGGNFWYPGIYGRSAARIVSRAQDAGSRHDGARLVCTFPFEAE